MIMIMHVPINSPVVFRVNVVQLKRVVERSKKNNCVLNFNDFVFFFLPEQPPSGFDRGTAVSL